MSKTQKMPISLIFISYFAILGLKIGLIAEKLWGKKHKMPSKIAHIAKK